MVFMLSTLVAFFSSTDNPRAWLDQSSGLDPQAQRTNLVSGTQGRKIIKQFITEDVFQLFVETTVAIYICWLTSTGIACVCLTAKLCECGRGFIGSFIFVEVGGYV